MPLNFHLQRGDVAGFKVGRSYVFGPRQNFFARDLFGVDILVPVAATEGLPIDCLLRDYLDPTGLGHFKHIRSRVITPDEQGLLRSSLSVLSHQAMLLRELIFEQVRLESFPEKPSRLKCIWLIPHSEELLARWCSTAPEGKFRAFEVEATGRFHHGASKWLKPECVGAARVRENALHYWSDPVDVLTQPAEILCEGEIKVLREIRMPGSKTTVWTKLKSLFDQRYDPAG